MNRYVAMILLLGALLLCGCRVGELGKSVMRNQKNTAKGVLYTDSLFTDDGKSRLVPPKE
ncbi:MAG: hypothetical protein NT045_07320 [Candidatus Aureabacteria bacterium]|nr:hypothetical protein [Candidatus Auribacterota bacterium]